MSEQKNLFEKIKSRLPARQALLGQFLRYFVTGGLAFVADFGLFAVAVYCFDIHYLVSNLIGLAAGSVINYLLTIGWVFSTEKRTMENHRVLEIAVFIVISLLGMAFNEVLMYVFVGMCGAQEMVSKAVAAVVVMMWNFVARKFIMFRSSNEKIKKE